MCFRKFAFHAGTKFIVVVDSFVFVFGFGFGFVVAAVAAVSVHLSPSTLTVLFIDLCPQCRP